MKKDFKEIEDFLNRQVFKWQEIMAFYSAIIIITIFNIMSLHDSKQMIVIFQLYVRY